MYAYDDLNIGDDKQYNSFMNTDKILNFIDLSQQSFYTNLKTLTIRQTSAKNIIINTELFPNLKHLYLSHNDFKECTINICAEIYMFNNNISYCNISQSCHIDMIKNRITDLNMNSINDLRCYFYKNIIRVCNLENLQIFKIVFNHDECHYINLSSIKNWISCLLTDVKVNFLKIKNLPDTELIKCEYYYNTGYLMEFDIEECPKLDTLLLKYNLLTSLDLSKISSLKYLDCSNNLLNFVNVDTNSLLSFDRSNNPLLA